MSVNKVLKILIAGFFVLSLTGYNFLELRSPASDQGWTSLGNYAAKKRAHACLSRI